MKKENKKNILKDYAGMSFQFLIGLGLFMFAGYKLDEWMRLSTPLTIWIFPLIYCLHKFLHSFKVITINEVLNDNNVFRA